MSWSVLRRLLAGPAPALVLSLAAACSGSGPIDTTGDDGDTDTTGRAPNIVVDKASIDFGQLEYGDDARANLTVSNTGQGTLTVEDVTTEDPFSTSFFSSLTLSPGASTNISVDYDPDDYFNDDADLVITSDDPDKPSLVVLLSGGVIIDGDGDGYDTTEAGGDDCDDDNPSIHPGATDTWYDGKDSDCDGADDYDQDGDGHQADGFNDNPDMGGGDCSDISAAVYPGAPDTWYDGVDSNCDGADDYDQDGDGDRTTAGSKGDDCDDTNPELHSEATEVLNSLDDDCDGTVDLEIGGTLADATVYGAAQNNYAGWAITMGDFDEDGSTDLVVGSYGYGGGRGLVSVWQGGTLPADGSTVEDANNDFQGSGSTDQLGYDVAYLADFTDDGPMLAVGVPGASSNRGAVYLLSGADVVTHADTGDAVVTVTAGTAGYLLGRGLAEDIDLDGDGLNELLGAYASASTGTSYNYLWMLYGGADGSVGLADVEARWTTTGQSTSMYRTFPGTGDFDGDGYADAMFCDSKTSTYATAGGSVWVLLGKAGEYDTSGTAVSVTTHWVESLVGKDKSVQVGTTCGAGVDINDDDADEIWTYATGDSAFYAVAGGPDIADGGMEPADAALVTFELGTYDPDIEVFSLIGDWTGDGISDVAVGTQASSGIAKGQVWLYSSQVTSGTWDAKDDALAALEGKTDDGNVYFGDAISSRPGDLDGDGKDDFVVGDPGWTDPVTSKRYLGGVFITTNKAP